MLQAVIINHFLFPTIKEGNLFVFSTQQGKDWVVFWLKSLRNIPLKDKATPGFLGSMRSFFNMVLHCIWF